MFWLNMLPYMTILVLTPTVIVAGEGVNVSFSVQAVKIKDRIRVQLPAKNEWALAASDITTGKSLVESEKAKTANFAPGSLVKLFVSAALLEENSRSKIDLSTMVLINGGISKRTLHGDIIIKGAGNSLLNSKDLFMALDEIQTLGIKKIEGDVVVDDIFFYVRNWKSRYTGPAYGIPSAFGLDLHTVSITVEASGRFVVDPPNDRVRISINPSGKRGIRQIDDLTYEALGVGQDAAAIRKRFSLTDPALYAGDTLLTLMKKQGISVSGTVKRGNEKLPRIGSFKGTLDAIRELEENGGREQSQLREVIRFGSRDIAEFILEMNRHSLNVAADNMLLFLGARIYGVPGTKEKGILALRNFLHELGVPLHGLVVNDGSGISELNRVSADQMLAFLQAVSKKPWFNDFYNSLSRPGFDGRLIDFGYRSDRIRMKSGEVTNAYALAGYVEQEEGRKIAFAFMVDGPGLKPAASSVAFDVLRQLTE